MANTPISGLDPNPNIDGTEEVALAKGGANFNETFNNIRTWMALTFSPKLVNGNATTVTSNTVGVGGVMTEPIAITGETQPYSITLDRVELVDSISWKSLFSQGYRNIDLTLFNNNTGQGGFFGVDRTSGMFFGIIDVNSKQINTLYDYDTGNITTTNEAGTGTGFSAASDYSAIVWGNATYDHNLATIKQVIDNTKVVTGFPTVKTEDFTVDDDSDGKYQDCNFTVEREVTLNLTSFTEEGKSVFFDMLGVGQIKFVAGTGINSIQQNSLQSDVVGSIGDVIEIMLKPNGILKII
jgi:hypothetical protein